MKKFLSVFLLLALLANMAACTTTPASAPATEAPSAQTTEAASPETEAAPETEAPATQTAKAPAEPTVLRVGVPKAPPALPVLRMMENNSLGENVTIELATWDEPEALIAMVQGGDHAMFAFPLTVVAKLHNKGLPVQLMNVNTWGVNYFVTSDPDVKDWSDLAGKTVYVALQSSPLDAMTQFFLKQAGLTVGEDVTIVYASMVEIATMLAAGEIEYATLIEPQVTRALSQNADLRVAFSFEEKWKEWHKDDSLIPTAGFGVMAPFAKENPDLVRDFQKAYAEAVQWVNDNPADAGALAEKHLSLPAPLVQAAIPKMGMLFKSAQDAKPELEMFYNLLNDFDATMIGGRLPETNMYYEE